MIEYSVMLERHKGSSRPDVCVFSDYDRETAIAEMGAYCTKNGFTVYDHDGRFTVADIVLVAREPGFESEWSPEQELIRCQDCKFCFAEGFVHEHNICDKHEWIQGQPDDWFCADGERGG